MDISPEVRQTPASRQELSDQSYPALNDSLKIDAEAYAMSVVHGNLNLVTALKPVLSAASLVDRKMSTDPLIPVAEKSKWNFITKNLPVDGAKSSTVINAALAFADIMSGKPEDSSAIDHLINKIETELVDSESRAWKVTPTTRQDALYRLKVLREVLDSIDDKASVVKTHSDTVTRTKAMSPQLRFIEGALSSFLAQSNPTLRPVVGSSPTEVL